MDIDMEKAYAANRETGERFLEENKSKEGIVCLDSGLQYRINVMGTGQKPKITSRVKVHYTGMLINGIVFDKTRGRAFESKLKDLIDGWVEAIQLMPVGSKWTLFIPHHLAYGASGAGVIGPYSALIFEIEVIGFR